MDGPKIDGAVLLGGRVLVAAQDRAAGNHAEAFGVGQDLLLLACGVVIGLEVLVGHEREAAVGPLEVHGRRPIHGLSHGISFERIPRWSDALCPP
jgi:hypothetical protein